ncbi:hypothetical protein [Campylobacter taeniopygiae]|uniref:Glutamyl-tRNA amidotransferase n=1 Tax=Campylobacter taeniopygiae TaxID=2510188 RepID=A0ABY2TGT6_9BACT|nr:hypothetical protein [Campylobacter taeniopygiae]TKX33331.1 hypothetical protein CQA75_08160 [Campylobacter taeniopygiae]
MTPLLTPPKMLALTLKELALMKRAQQNLANIDEITREVVAKAAKDADDVCKNKDVAGFIWEDFAYIRIKIYLKIVLDDEDKMLLDNALKQIQNAPIVDQDGNLNSLRLRVMQRKDKF